MKHIEPAARRAAGFVCVTEIPKKAAAENRFHSIMIQKAARRPEPVSCFPCILRVTAPDTRSGSYGGFSARRYDRPCCNTDCPGSHERIRSGSSRPAMLHTRPLFFRAYRFSFHAGGCRRINSPQRFLLRAPFDRTRLSDRRYTPDRSALRLPRPPGILPGCRRNSCRRLAPSIPPACIRPRR